MGSSSSAPVLAHAAGDAAAKNDRDDDGGVDTNGGEIGKWGALAPGALRPPDADSERNAHNRRRFARENRVLVFNWTTFWEELFCQYGFERLGPFILPLIVYICGVNGAKLTQFLPGQHPTDPEHSVTGDFIGQLLPALFIGMPVVVFTVLCLGGNLDETIAPRGSVMPHAELYLPLALGLIRQLVIAVKYAYIPRRRMRDLDRRQGRHPKAFENDLMAMWSGAR